MMQLNAEMLPVLEDMFLEKGASVITRGPDYRDTTMNGCGYHGLVIVKLGYVTTFVTVTKTHIRLQSLMKDGRAYDVSFAIGDLAEYDSFNLRYLAPIKSFSIKSVVFHTPDHRGGKTRRLKLADFVMRNYNFNVTEIEAHNDEVSLHI